MKILITGGAGFIGKWFLKELNGEHEIVIVDSLDPQAHPPSTRGEQRDFEPELLAKATCVAADVRDCEAYADAARDSEVVIHLAAQTGTGQSMYERSRYVGQNVDGTARLLDVVSSWSQPPRLLMLSSSRAVYGEGAYATEQQPTSSLYYPRERNVNDLQAGLWEPRNEAGALRAVAMQESHQTNPTSVYGLTKLWQEQLFTNYAATCDAAVAILRFQNVYGPGQELRNPYTGIVGIFAGAIARQKEIELFEDGEMTRDFVFVQDVAHVMNRIAESPQLMQEVPGGILNVGSGRATTLRELVHTLAHLSGSSPEVRTSGRFRTGDIRHAVGDVSLLEKVLDGWNPTSLQEGLGRYLAWYQTEARKGDDSAKLEESLAEMAAHGMLRESDAAARAVA